MLNALIIFLVTLALFVLIEGALRMVYPGKTTRETIAYEFNEDYLISLKSNIEKTYIRSAENGGDVIVWKTNDDSFRGASLKENPRF